jgi:hypothetical protein
VNTHCLEVVGKMGCSKSRLVKEQEGPHPIPHLGFVAQNVGTFPKTDPIVTPVAAAVEQDMSHGENHTRLPEGQEMMSRALQVPLSRPEPDGATCPSPVSPLSDENASGSGDGAPVSEVSVEEEATTESAVEGVAEGSDLRVVSNELDLTHDNATRNDGKG